MSNSRRQLFAELFADYVTKTCTPHYEFEEEHRFYEAVVFWNSFHKRYSGKDTDLHDRNKAIYVFAKNERYNHKRGATFMLTPTFGSFLQDVQFNDVMIAPVFSDEVNGYCIEFPDTVRFSDDQEKTFWRSAIIIMFVDQESDCLKMGLLVPDYDSEDQLTGATTLIKYQYDYAVDAATNIERIIESYTQDHLSHEVIEYALKAFFYIESIGTDVRVEKGFKYIDAKNINPLRKPEKSRHTVAYVGGGFEHTITRNKGYPPWHWTKTVDRGMPGFKLELG